jgi:hypothetical protein
MKNISAVDSSKGGIEKRKNNTTIDMMGKAKNVMYCN